MATYKIIGGDSKEYGPVTADDLRHWIAEGRLSGQSLVQAEGTGEWKALATFSELAEALGAQIGQASFAELMPTPFTAEALARQILEQGPRVEIGRCLARSWNLLTENFGLLYGATFLVWLCSLSQFIPFLGLIYQLLAGVLYGGLYLIILNRIRGRPAAIGEVFAGFSVAFAQLLLAHLISMILGAIGFLFCLVPGFYLLVAWVFSVPLVADKRLEFWSAMELSRKVVTRVWFEVFGLLLLAFLPALSMQLFAQITMSMKMFAVMHDVMRSSQPDFRHMADLIKQIMYAGLPLAFVTRVILLLNLPFALGALMYAYEDLFGSRTARTP